MLAMTKDKNVPWTQISPLGEACLRMDLKAIHKILVMAEYEDDKEVIEVTKHSSILKHDSTANLVSKRFTIFCSCLLKNGNKRRKIFKRFENTVIKPS